MMLTQKNKERIINGCRKVYETFLVDLGYTMGYSSVAGLGNALAAQEHGENFESAFGEAYVHNFPPGMAANLAYPVVFNRLREGSHYRLYANLFTIGVNAGFLAWHYLCGTEHPLQTMIPNTLAGLAMANFHVTKTRKETNIDTLETRLA